MAYWLGGAFLILAAYFVWSARRHKARSLAATARRKADGLPEPKLHPSLSILADVMPSLTVVGMGAFAALIVVAYFAVDASQWFTLFDLGAFLTSIAAYGFWVTIKAKYRQEDDEPIAARNPQTRS